MTPREPDRFDAKTIRDYLLIAGVEDGSALYWRVAAQMHALRSAAESSALERARKALLPMRGRAIDDALARVDWLIAETKESLIPSAAAPAADVSDLLGRGHVANPREGEHGDAETYAAETGKARCQCTIGSVATSCVYAAPDCVCECACHAAAAETGKGRGADKIGYCKTCGLDASHGVCNDPRDARIAELEAALRQIIAAPTIELTTYEVIREMRRLATVALAARAAPPEGEGK